MSGSARFLRAKEGTALSTDELRAKIPAIFAESKHFSRSERYVEVNTVSVLEELDRHGFYPIAASQASPRDFSKTGKCKHVVRLRSRDGIAERALNKTFFEIVLGNSFDGSYAWQFDAGAYRLVCLNGMTVADNVVASVNVKHSGNKQRLLAQVVEGVHAVVAEAPKVLDAVANWSKIELNGDERREFAGRAHKLRFEDRNTPVKPDQLLIPRRFADVGRDLWTTFNVIQENCIRGGLAAPRFDVARGRTIHATTREVHGIDQDRRINKGLWAAANDIAKLKQAA